MGEPREHSINDYNKLLLLLRERAEKIGLIVHSAGIIPPFSEDAPVLIQVSFAVGEATEEEAEVSDEQKAFDEQFKELLSGQEKLSENEIREQLKKDFKEGGELFGGFGDK